MSRALLLLLGVPILLSPGHSAPPTAPAPRTDAERLAEAVRFLGAIAPDDESIDFLAKVPLPQAISPPLTDPEREKLPPGGLLRFGRRNTGRGPVEHIAVSADGTQIAVAHCSGTVYLWDAITGRQLKVVGEGQGMLSDLAFTPEGKVRCVGRKVAASALSPDGKLKALASWEGTFQLHEAGGKFLTEDSFRDASWPLFFEFSPDAKLLLIGGGEAAHVWDVKRRRFLGPEFPHIYRSHRGRYAAFSPDGKTIAATIPNGIALWERASGKERLRLGGPGAEKVYFHCLAFLPDGKHLVAGGLDGTALLWDLRGQAAHEQRPSPALSPTELRRLAADLAGADAVRAYTALWSLTAEPQRSIALIAEQLRPAEKEPAFPSREWLLAQRGVELLERIGNAEARQVLNQLAQQRPNTPVGEDAAAALRRLARRSGKP